MNKIFKVKKNSRGLSVATSELAKGHGKLKAVVVAVTSALAVFGGVASAANGDTTVLENGTEVELKPHSKTMLDDPNSILALGKDAKAGSINAVGIILNGLGYSQPQFSSINIMKENGLTYLNNSLNRVSQQVKSQVLALGNGAQAYIGQSDTGYVTQNNSARSSLSVGSNSLSVSFLDYSNVGSTAVGSHSIALNDSVSFGEQAMSQDRSTSIGVNASSFDGGIAVGYNSSSTGNGVALGTNANTSVYLIKNNYAVALGSESRATEKNSVSLGNYGGYFYGWRDKLGAETTIGTASPRHPDLKLTH